MTDQLPTYSEEAKELAERINYVAVKYDKASNSRFLNEGIAAAHIAEFLEDFALRVSNATRIQQTREIIAHPLHLDAAPIEMDVRHRCSTCLRDFSSLGSCIVHIGNYHSLGGVGEYDPKAYAIPKSDSV